LAAKRYAPHLQLGYAGRAKVFWKNFFVMVLQWFTRNFSVEKFLAPVGKMYPSAFIFSPKMRRLCS
jgi:hypothetical protein